MPRKGVAKGRRELRFELRYCELLVEFMGRGYSLTAFAGEIGTSRAKLTRWSREHAAFAKAVECGQARRARLLEERLLGTDATKAFGVNMQALKTAAPDEWPSKATTGVTRGGPTCRSRPAAEANLDLPDNGRDVDDVH